MKQHAQGFLGLVNQAKQHIQEITPAGLQTMIDQHAAFYLIDVREDHEWLSGHIPGALHLSKGIIERDIQKHIADVQASLVVYCSGGFRSALVAESLQAMGYTTVMSLSSGLQGWLDAGHALVP